MCVCSNSRNDVPRVTQRYGTIAAHTRRHASVLVVFVVFSVHMHSFAGLIRRTPPPTFSDTAITDRHSDTTIFQLRAHWVRISWSIGCTTADNQKRIYSTKGHHSVKTECRVIVLFLCTTSDEAVYLYKIHDYVLNGFRDVKHKSTSLMVLKNDTVDTVLNYKLQKA